MAKRGQIQLPPNIPTDGPEFLPIIRKEDQYVHIILPERLPDGSFRQTPEDPGILTMILSGALVALKLWKHTPDTSGLLDTFAKIVFSLSGQDMKIVEQLSGNELPKIGSTARKGKNPKVPLVHQLPE
jgi:hypothetical protein